MNARLTILLCIKIIVAKCKELKTGCNLNESSKEGYGSKRAVLPMIMMMYRTPPTAEAKNGEAISQIPQYIFMA
jgi:hypothetical protein